MFETSSKVKATFKFLEEIENELNSSIKDLFSIKSIENDVDGKYFITIPGYSKEDFDIKLNGNALVISTKKERKDFYGMKLEPMTRKFKIGSNVNLNSIKAKAENGILVLSYETIQKEANEKSINVE